MSEYSDNDESFMEMEDRYSSSEEESDELKELVKLRKENDELKANLAALTTCMANLTSEMKLLREELSKTKSPNQQVRSYSQVLTSEPGTSAQTNPNTVIPPKKITSIIEDSNKVPKPQGAPPAKRARKESTSSIENNSKKTTVTPQSPATEKIPPVTMMGTSDWTEMSKALYSKKINYNRATVVKDGIKIIASSAEDFRKLTKFLDQQGKEYFTYQMEEEKRVYAVIRYLPLDADIDVIKNDLGLQGIKDAEVTRMTSNKTKKAMPLYLVKTQHKEIFQVKKLYSLCIEIEPKKKPEGPGQCHRCQRYGHAQNKCTFPWRCVKCLGAHCTKECALTQKEGERNAACVLCNQSGHPASYKGCSAYKNLTKKKTPTKKEAPPKKIAEKIETVVTVEKPQVQKTKNSSTKPIETRREDPKDELDKLTEKIFSRIMQKFEKEFEKKFQNLFGNK